MAYGMKTVPIVLGPVWTKVMVLLLIALTVFMLIYIQLKYILFSVEPADYFSLVYFVLFLILPLIGLSVQVLVAKNKQGYGRASKLIKVVMLTGILYSVLVFYLVNFKY